MIPAMRQSPPGRDSRPKSFEDKRMLELRPNCECCDKDLPPDSREAMICSFECTFCASCAGTVLGGRCPNCGGGFAQRPIRPPAALARHPASTARVFKPEGCRAAAGG
jgi:hypothetical protein